VKTISVREVAEALEISPRGVLYRREKGQLKGILIKNDRGVDEYRIYPTKEIIEGLKRINSPLVASEEAIEDFDVVDAQTISEEHKIFDSTYGPEDVVERSAASRPNWTETSKAAASGMAEELWNNVISRFMEKLEEKDQLIGEMRTELKEKERQLLLLPDLEAQAENERKAAELKELEAEALRKQIEAMQALQTEAEESKRRANEAIQQFKADKEAEAKALEEENEQLRKKAEEAANLAADLQSLKSTVEELQKPKPSWWQKLFSAPSEP